MVEGTDRESFEAIVEWAYGTLPEKIREQADFPGIQVVDEPPEDIVRMMVETRHWPHGIELLGCYTGIFRTKRSHSQMSMSPDLIFVFRGPIIRCSRGNLRDEVKRVVWHEVAHWLGYETEEQVGELGL
ncbi:MAG TPA: metallopeptidase family protein [Terriglobales bacterium]|nr:metallopeptidase family protein [Terriglobales bacterium]